jgi:hypothetical protein
VYRNAGHDLIFAHRGVKGDISLRISRSGIAAPLHHTSNSHVFDFHRNSFSLTVVSKSVSALHRFAYLSGFALRRPAGQPLFLVGRQYKAEYFHREHRGWMRVASLSCGCTSFPCFTVRSLSHRRQLLLQTWRILHSSFLKLLRNYRNGGKSLARGFTFRIDHIVLIDIDRPSHEAPFLRLVIVSILSAGAAPTLPFIALAKPGHGDQPDHERHAAARTPRQTRPHDILVSRIQSNFTSVRNARTGGSSYCSEDEKASTEPSASWRYQQRGKSSK